MNPNIHPNVFWVNIRTRGSQPSICVLTFTQFTSNRIPRSWNAPTGMKNRSRTPDGDARRSRSGWWRPTSNMRKSSNANNAVAWLALQSASYGALKRRSWRLSVQSTEGKPFIRVMEKVAMAIIGKTINAEPVGVPVNRKK